MNKKNLVKKSRAYALKNAVAYNGKAQQGSVLSALFNEGLKKNKVKDYIKDISKVIKEVNSLSHEEQKKEFEKLKKDISKRKVREGLPDLPDAKKGKVVMRIAPSPSGAFHIGHAMTACISFLFVQRYGGKFYVRIEDTNPDNIYKLAYNLIKKDSDWLFDKKAKIIIQSERMEIYYKYAEKLIKLGHAYVCTCPGDDFRKCVKLQQDCPCRSLNPKENKERWEMMFDVKSYKSGDAVLRFKSDMTHKNPAMRDFPLARINETPHPLQKKKYRVWPLMNLAVPVDDIEMGMTHIVRAKEHIDAAKRQKMIFKVLGKKFPWTGFLGRWHIKGLRLSASEITKGIKEGKYSGWGDSKLPTIQALKKKYKPQAFWKFAENIGLSESDKIIDKKEFFELLDAQDEKYLKGGIE
ncbi:hypothetical protein CMI44_02040 [Candidatus Pacearchaeota archaeon]|nr:hypothetical protein [Candidatus Pacearchaeota archaeon]|tara:strand:- start:1275 stop:2501 length:1227 start_codon:yes stop_codon:yes gene_type:complete